MVGNSPTFSDQIRRNAILHHTSCLYMSEFVKMMTLKHRGIDLDAELREAFDLFDVENNGYITKDAIFQLLNSLGENVTRSDVDQMIAEVDQDGDGHISCKSPLHVLVPRTCRKYESSTDTCLDEEFACFIKDNK